jgi:tetratricopeptide (TPR) repeat protein
LIREVVFVICISASLYCFPNSRDEIDQYNQGTIDLLNDLDSCLVRVDYTIERAEDIGYEYGQGYALYLKGYIHRMQDDLGKAFLANLKGLNILAGNDDERAPETLVRLYLNTGEILVKHFKYSEGIQYYSEGLEIAKREKLNNWIIDLNYNTGNAYWRSGDLAKAIDHIHEAFKIAQQENDEYTLVNSLNQMGLVFKDNEMYDTATLFFNRILTHPYEGLDADKYKGRAYHNLANTYAQAGDTIEAITAFYKALEYKQKRNRPTEIFITQNDLAELFFKNGDLDLAKEMIQRCIENYEEMRLDPDHYKVFDLARKINSAMGEHTLVNHYANRYFDENDAFIKQQEKLIEIRDQFKMEVLTASFFGELERNKRIAQLNKAILWISLLALIVIGYLRIKQIWMKRLVGKAVGELVRE